MHRGLPAVRNWGISWFLPEYGKCQWTSLVHLWSSLDAFFCCLPLLQCHPAGFHPVGLLRCPACKAPPTAAEPLAARTSLLPVPVSVQAAARIPPVMPHQTSLGAQKCGLPLKPTTSRRVQTPARSASPQQCHVSFPAAAPRQPRHGQLGKPNWI